MSEEKKSMISPPFVVIGAIIVGWIGMMVWPMISEEEAPPSSTEPGSGRPSLVDTAPDSPDVAVSPDAEFRSPDMRTEDRDATLETRSVADLSQQLREPIVRRWRATTRLLVLLQDG